MATTTDVAHRTVMNEGDTVAADPQPPDTEADTVISRRRVDTVETNRQLDTEVDTEETHQQLDTDTLVPELVLVEGMEAVAEARDMKLGVAEGGARLQGGIAEDMAAMRGRMVTGVDMVEELTMMMREGGGVIKC